MVVKCDCNKQIKKGAEVYLDVVQHEVLSGSNSVVLVSALSL
jgi:hypothetical protein